MWHSILGIPGVVFKNWIDVHYAVYKGHYTSISIEGHMNSEIVQTSCRWQYHLTLVKHKKLYTSPIYPILYSAHIPHPLLGMPTFLSKVVEPLFFSSAKKHLAILFLLTAYFSFFSPFPLWLQPRFLLHCLSLHNNMDAQYQFAIRTCRLAPIINPVIPAQAVQDWPVHGRPLPVDPLLSMHRLFLGGWAQGFFPLREKVQENPSCAGACCIIWWVLPNCIVGES